MIPNIVHFVFGFKEQTEDFYSVIIYLFILYIVNKPDQILFYYHYEPKGKWWEELENTLYHGIKNRYSTEYQ